MAPIGKNGLRYARSVLLAVKSRAKAQSSPRGRKVATKSFSKGNTTTTKSTKDTKLRALRALRSEKTLVRKTSFYGFVLQSGNESDWYQVAAEPRGVIRRS
jgi:hypothetical protein